MLTYRQMISEVMWHLVTHEAHGYSQANRAGDGTTESTTLSDGTVVKLHGGDYDCSEAVRMCCAAAGLLPWGYWDSYMWTGNEHEMLTSHGFTQVSLSSAEDGDILWRSGHTEVVCVRNGKKYQAGFRRSEYHSTTGKKGDQDGYEATYSTYVPSSWTRCYRYTGPERKVSHLIGYRAHCETYGWQDWKYDGQTAGTTGQSKRLEGLRLDLPAGLALKVTAHLQGVGNVTYTYMTSGMTGFTIGSENNSRRMEGIQFDVVSNTTGKSLRYRVHMQTYGWGDWVGPGTFAGTTGQSKRLEAIEIKLV